MATHSRLVIVSLAITVIILSFTLDGLFVQTALAPTPTEPPRMTPYLETEELIAIPVATTTATITDSILLPIDPPSFQYVEVTDGCGIHFEGECLNVRSGPGLEFPVVHQLRNGVVLKVGGTVTRDDALWYRITFDEWLRYPERVSDDWYVNAAYVSVLYDEGERTSWEHEVPATTTQRIVVDVSEQRLQAYDGEVLFLETPISTGLEITPTPMGTFTIFKKTPSRYMQGPLPGLVDQQVYDLPGVPWNLYFTSGGAVIHGAYWHNSFGSKYSHGCVNVPLAVARRLYRWTDLGTTVTIQP
jgi:hypothetical protein